MEMDINGQGRRHHLPRNIFNSQFGQVYEVVALVLFYWHPLHHMGNTLVATKWQSEAAPASVDVTDQEVLAAPGLSNNPTHSLETSPPAIPLLPDLPFEDTLLIGHSFFESLAGPSQQKWGHSPSGSFGDHHEKRTQKDSLDVELKSEHSSAQHNDHLPDLIPGTRTGSRWQRQEYSSPSSSPIRDLTNTDDEAVTGSSKSTRDWTSLNTSLSKGNMANSDPETPSGDCLSCSDTDEVSIWTAWKKYRKWVRASCNLCKGRLDGGLNEKNQGQSSRHMGPWPHHHHVRVKMHSSQRLRIFWDVEDDHLNQPFAPHCGDHQLQSPPAGVHGWDRWQGKRSQYTH